MTVDVALLRTRWLYRRSGKRSISEKQSPIVSIASKDPLSAIQQQKVPVTQSVLLLHGVKQQYQLTGGYPVPEIWHDHELLVKSHTVGLNPIDWKAPDFGFGIPQLPYISGRESAGAVVKAPINSPRIKLGDNVIVISTDYRDLRKATYQEYVVAADFNVARIPPQMSVRDGATLGVAYAAASLALGVCLGVDFTRVHGGPDLLALIGAVPPEALPGDIRDECLAGVSAGERARAGDWVAVWGGSSTSANMVTQLARLAGLRVASVVDKAKHGLRISDDPALRPDLLVDSFDPERAVAILRANTGNRLRFGIDTRGGDSAGLLLRALGPGDSSRGERGGRSGEVAETPSAGSAAITAHLVGLSGLPKGTAPVGAKFHQIPIKLFHEVPPIGEALCSWLERLLASGAIAVPRIIDVEEGLPSVNKGLDRMRRGEISGGKLVVNLGIIEKKVLVDKCDV